MTYREMFNKSLSLTLTPKDEGKDLEAFAADIFEMMLGETVANNNQIRKKKGIEPIIHVPTVKELDVECPYEDELNTAFIYGIGAKLLIADGENIGQAYQGRYENELAAATPILCEDIEDVY